MHGAQAVALLSQHACPMPQGAVQVMAKSLVRNRHAVTKMYGLKSQLQAVSLRIAVRWGRRCVAGRGSCSSSCGL